MDACGKRPDPPLLACRRAEQRLKILALRSHGSGGGSARGCPAPRAAATREDPTPLKASELGVWPALGRGSLGVTAGSTEKRCARTRVRGRLHRLPLALLFSS